MLRAPTPQSELAAVRQRLRALQKQACKSQQKQNLRQVGPLSWRCAPASSTCMVVFVYSGGSADIAADFAQGRGWWKSAGKPPLRFSLGRRQEAVNEIEVAYDTAPLSQILAIESNPVEAGLVIQPELVNIVRWLVEHSLYQWVEKQNSEHGVALSRMQLVEGIVCRTYCRARVRATGSWTFLDSYSTQPKKVVGKIQVAMGLATRQVEGLQFFVNGGEAVQGWAGARPFLVARNAPNFEAPYNKRSSVHLESVQRHFW